MFSMLFKIAREAEAAIFHKELFENLRFSNFNLGDSQNAVSVSAVEASYHSLATAIIVLTNSG